MRRSFAFAFLVLALATRLTVVGAPAAPSHEREVLGYVGDVTAWHQRVVSLEQGQATPGEVLFRDAVSRASRQTLDFTFDYARAEAARIEATRTAGDTAAAAATRPATTTATSEPARGRRLQRAAAEADARVSLLQSQLDEADRRLAAANGLDVARLGAERDRLAAALNLVTVRRDVMRQLAQFRAGSDGGAEGGLLDQIDALQRSVPAPPGQDATVSATAAAAAGAAAAPAASRPESAGVVGLISQMFELSRRIRELDALADQAASLRQAGDKLRAPLRSELMAAARRADAVGSAGGMTAQKRRARLAPARLARTGRARTATRGNWTRSPYASSNCPTPPSLCGARACSSSRPAPACSIGGRCSAVNTSSCSAPC